MTLANKLTISRILLAPAIVAVAAVAFSGWNYYAAAIFVFAALTDTVDGRIARKYNQITDFGKLIDPIADKLLTSASMLVLIGWQKIPFWVGMILITRDIVVSAMRIVAADHDLVVAARKSGKIKTLLQLIAYGAYLFNVDTIGHVFLVAGVLTTLWSLADYLYANRHVFMGSMMAPFILSFVDKLLSAYLLFFLVGAGRMPALAAMLILGKDNIISGIKAMSSANGRRIPMRPSEAICFVLHTAWTIAILFGASWAGGIGLPLFIVSAISMAVAVADVARQSRAKPTRVR